MNLPHKVGIGILSVWFVVCSVLIVQYGLLNKTEFDPKMALSSAIMDATFESELYAQLSTNSSATNKEGKVFHIVQGECYCEWLAEPHQKKLDIWAGEHAFTTLYLNVDALDSATVSKYLPSTPAVVAFDASNKLIYMGPYSRGSGCFGKTGEIDTQLERWLNLPKSNQDFINPVIDTDARGCYCAT